MKPEKQKKHAALRALLIALLTLALLAVGFAAYRFWRLPRAGFAVHFVDIGQGDAAIWFSTGKRSSSTAGCRKAARSWSIICKTRCTFPPSTP